MVENYPLASGRFHRRGGRPAGIGNKTLARVFECRKRGGDTADVYCFSRRAHTANSSEAGRSRTSSVARTPKVEKAGNSSIPRPFSLDSATGSAFCAEAAGSGSCSCCQKNGRRPRFWAQPPPTRRGPARRRPRPRASVPDLKWASSNLALTLVPQLRGILLTSIRSLTSSPAIM